MMEEETMKEPWTWLDEVLKLDPDAPSSTSSSLWDDFAQNEAVVRSLFPSKGYSHSNDSDSVGFSSCTMSDSSQLSGTSWDILSDCNPCPSKRRRIMQFDGDDVIDMSSLMMTSLENFNSSALKSGDCPEVILPSSLLCMPTEESLGSVDDSVDQQSTGNWMVGCISDTDTSEVQQIPGSHRVHTLNAASSKTLLTRSRGETFKTNPTSRRVNTKSGCPLPRPSKPKETVMFSGFRSQQCEQVKQQRSDNLPEKKLNHVLAYPFALVKPIGIQGDLTLQDINQRINGNPPIVKNDCHQIKTTLTSSLSGKSVLALTKIYTEGKGIITIKKTRGEIRP